MDILFFNVISSPRLALHCHAALRRAILCALASVYREPRCLDTLRPVYWLNDTCVLCYFQPKVTQIHILVRLVRCNDRKEPFSVKPTVHSCELYLTASTYCTGCSVCIQRNYKAYMWFCKHSLYIDVASQSEEYTTLLTHSHTNFLANYAGTNRFIT
jgi:hypothetical protein